MTAETTPLTSPGPIGSRDRKAPRGTRAGWTVVLLSSLAIAGYFVGQYAFGSLDTLAKAHVGLAPTYADRPAVIQGAFYAHITFAGLALALGPFQFWAGLRHKHPKVHRVIGRTYLISVGIGGAAALVMAPFSSAGFIGFFGFGGLAAVWLFTGWKAYTAIRRRDIPSHRAWMMRNFALTYAAVTLRTWFAVLILLQIPFLPHGLNLQGFLTIRDLAYAPTPFLCWLPNLLVAEWLIRRRGLPTVTLATRTTSAATV